MKLFQALGFTIIIMGAPSPVFAEDTYIDGYIRDDGGYVQPHFRSQADNYTDNNFSSRGNTNPYTEERGTESIPMLGSPNSGENNFNAQPSARSWNNDKPRGSSYQNPPRGM